MNNVEEKCGDVGAHVLIFPSPAQGHVNSMLKLAELLALYDVHVTFLNTDYIHQRLMRFGDIEALLACYSTLQFKTISDCFTEDQHPGFGDRIGVVIDSINLHAKPLLRDILVSENSGKPRVTCIIADGIFGSLTTDLAGEVGIPCIHFRTISACCFWAYLCVPKLFHCKELPIRGKEGEEQIPVELEEGTKVGWAPQEEVLAHKAIGGFLTYSGWNSTLESVVAGWNSTLEICWPYFADQQINSRFVSEAWKLGLDMKDVCDRNVVEKMVNDLMVHRREEFQRSAQVMATLAYKSVSQAGSSYSSLDDLIQYIKPTSQENHR